MKSLLKKLLYKILITLMDREKLLFLITSKSNTERELLGFKTGGYLHDIGWTNSIATSNIVDLTNDPLPWVTYPFIEFIGKRLQKDFDIFEFGSGNSTLYYSKHVASVDSVENDLFWFNKIKNEMPANANLFYQELVNGGDYSKYSLQTGKKYDMIVVDGRDRVNCCKESVNALKPTGVIILDDSERAEYSDGIGFLVENGFKKIDFWGIAPAVNYLKCTTLFYRDNNCLEI